MENNLKVYEYIFDPTRVEMGIELISMVLEPATDIIGVALSAEDVIEVKFSIDNAEERILVSPVLVPNQMIFRKNINGEPSRVFASKETIKLAQQHFVRNGNQNNSNIEHQGEKLTGITFTEQWLVRDSKMDTINSYGFSNIPEGSWCVKAQLSQELWDNYIKTGKVKGFSVEGLLGIKRVEMSTEIKHNIPPYHDSCKCSLNSDGTINSEEDVCDYCKEQIQIQEKQKIKLSKMNKQTIEDIVAEARKSVRTEVVRQVALASEMTEFKDVDGKSYYATELVLDAIVTDAENAIIANAEFVIEGNTYKTDENGVIVSVEPVASEEEAPKEETELADEVPPVEGEAPEGEEEIEDVQVLKDKIAEQEKIIAELEAKNIELEAKLVEFEDKAKADVALAKQTPASSGIKDTAVALKSDVKPEKESMSELLNRLRK